MSSFKVTGGKKLRGEITPQGAKNEALQVICAVLLSSEPVTIHNIPNIRDVQELIEILEELGVHVNRISESSITFDASSVQVESLYSPTYMKKAAALRGSVMLLGPLLARFKKGRIPSPGGDKIGQRRLDTHFVGFTRLGARFQYYETAGGIYELEADHLVGTYMLLDEASVTGTANIIMASVFAEGTTTIYNAACEPYIQQLCKMLIRMGANISGIGSNLLTIEGVTSLYGTEHTLLPDMIEVGSFIGLAAMTGSQIRIKNCAIKELGIIPSVFSKLGIHMEFIGDDIVIPAQEHYEIESFINGAMLTISDHPWPGFTPDLLSIVLVTAIQAKGSVLIHQKMFESRLFFVDRLIQMGAQITLCDPHRVLVIGADRSRKLRGIRMSSPDIRAGVSLLIAAMSAQGESIIDNVEQIDRGYQNIDTRLNALGAEIIRI